MIDDAVALVPRGLDAEDGKEAAQIGRTSVGSMGDIRARDFLLFRRRWPGTQQHVLENVTLWCGAEWPHAATRATVAEAVSVAEIQGAEIDSTDPQFLECLPSERVILRGTALERAKKCVADGTAADAHAGNDVAKPWVIAVIVAAGAALRAVRPTRLPVGPGAAA